MPKVSASIYRDPRWIELRKQRRRDPDYREALKRCGKGERVILDHVVEIKDGGAPFDAANTQWLTFSEHQAKTAREKARRAGMA